MPQLKSRKQQAKKAFAFGIISKIKKKDNKVLTEEEEKENEEKKKQEEEEKEQQEHQELVEMAQTMPIAPKGKRRFIDILLEKKQQRTQNNPAEEMARKKSLFLSNK